MCLCVTLIHHCPVVNSFNVATLKNHVHAFKIHSLSCFWHVGNGKYNLVLIKVIQFIGKGYLIVLKMSFSKQFQIAPLLTDAQSLDTAIHQGFLKGSTEY